MGSKKTNMNTYLPNNHQLHTNKVSCIYNTYMKPIRNLTPADVPLAISLILNYLSTIVFAISGTRLALAAGYSALAAVVSGVITANGGGTIRDIVMRKKLFWIEQPGFIIVSLLCAIAATFITYGSAPGSAMYGVYGYL